MVLGEMRAFFLSLSLSVVCWVLGSLDDLAKKKKKKNSTRAPRLLLPAREQRFPRFNTCKASVVAVVIARVAVPVAL